jgi:hypothetical protein
LEIQRKLKILLKKILSINILKLLYIGLDEGNANFI